MTIKELQPGDTFYMPVAGYNIGKYTYIGRHPRNYKMFIFYDNFDKVVVKGIDEVNEMLEVGVQEYWDAYKASIEKVKELAVTMEEYMSEHQTEKYA